MQDDGFHAECVGNQAGVLAASAAEAVKRVLGDVVTALHGDLLDGIGHILHCDAKETVGDGVRARFRLAGGAGDLGGELGKLAFDDIGIQCLVSVRTKDLGKVFRLDLAEHDVAVGDRQRPAAAVTGRAGIGPGAVGADAVARAVEVQDRATASGNGVDMHHRCAHAHAGDQRLKSALVLAIVVRNVS